jgi:hypothetical protein
MKLNLHLNLVKTRVYHYPWYLTLVHQHFVLNLYNKVLKYLYKDDHIILLRLISPPNSD